jgi:hypothetical protein
LKDHVGIDFPKKRECEGPLSTPCICVCTLLHKALAEVYSSNPRALRHPSPLSLSLSLPAPVVAIAAITRTNMANFDALFSLCLSRQKPERISMCGARGMNSAAGCIRKRATPDSSLPFWDRPELCVCTRTDSSITLGIVKGAVSRLYQRTIASTYLHKKCLSRNR